MSIEVHKSGRENATGTWVLAGDGVIGEVVCTEQQARLLASAPFMLTALEEIAEGCQRRLSKGYDNGDAWTLRVCRTAITKAEGRAE